jgi:opacity protein-like surface antigen
MAAAPAATHTFLVRRILLVLVLAFVAAPASAADAPEPRRFAVGTNGMGVLLRLNATPDWAGEFRFQAGSATSSEGDVRATVFTLRGYRFFPERYRVRFYAGAEGGYAKTSLSNQSTSPGASPLLSSSGFGATTGFVAGVFGGLEYRIVRRVFLDLDAGPYLISLKESATRTSGSSADFVANAAIGVYLF